MNAKLVVGVVVALVLTVGAYYLVLRHKEPAAQSITPSAAEWETYKDAKWRFSLDHPKDFTVSVDESLDTFKEIHITDPSGNLVVDMAVWATSDPGDEEMFTGPYPRQLTSTNGYQTVVERTINGLKGIEVYGTIAEGHGFNDVFLYRRKYVWGIYLNPIVEGRLTAEEYAARSDGSLPPAFNADIYHRIVNSFRIFDQ